MPPGSGLASRISTSCPNRRRVVGARQARRAGADHEHPLAGRRPRRDRPSLLVGEIAEEPVERMDRDGLIEELPVAGAFAGVITGAAVRAGQRVLLHVLPPGALVVARLRQGEPGLDVLPGRTGVIAGRQMIDVDRALPSTRAGAFADGLLCKPASNPSERDSRMPPRETEKPCRPPESRRATIVRCLSSDSPRDASGPGVRYVLSAITAPEGWRWKTSGRGLIPPVLRSFHVRPWVSRRLGLRARASRAKG